MILIIYIYIIKKDREKDWKYEVVCESLFQRIKSMLKNNEQNGKNAVCVELLMKVKKI